MAESLGIYIEGNLIKYAKVSKDHDKIKVDSFGVKPYESIDDAINQIVQETSSLKTPISVNLSDELYNYFEIFSLLNKKDIERAIKTEFEYLCEERDIKQNTIETRYVLVPSLDNKEKIRAVHISTNRVEIAKRTQQLQGRMLRSISPLPLTLTNLLNINDKENFAILNIEDKTTLTIIVGGQIYKIQNIDEGMLDVLSKISAKENSFARAYEICKNTTIYTMESQITETDEHLEDIMPTVYSILEKVKETLKSLETDISKLYITGSGAMINNIDLYFQDNMDKIKCQILKPYFISAENGKFSVKDYIEVNSALALALQGLGEGIGGINFKELTVGEKIVLPSFNIPMPRVFEKLKSKGGTKKLGLNSPLDTNEIRLLRFATFLLLIVIIYGILSNVLSNAIKEKDNEVLHVSQMIQSEISKGNMDLSKIQTRTNEYNTRINNLRNTSQVTNEKLRAKNSIPNLLNQIMFVIPKSVQLTSIKNTDEKHIIINAQSEAYEQLAYFKGKLEIDEILVNVQSDSSSKQNGIIKVTIEGDLP